MDFEQKEKLMEDLKTLAKDKAAYSIVRKRIMQDETDERKMRRWENLHAKYAEIFLKNEKAVEEFK